MEYQVWVAREPLSSVLHSPTAIQVSISIIAAFVDYLRFKCGMEDSSVKKQYKNLVAFLNWCQAHGYAHLPDVATYHPVFKTPGKPVIFLTHEELMRLYNFELPKSGEKVKIHDMSGREIEETVLEPGALAKTRDLFCFCAFTSLRYSDMANVHRYDINEPIRITGFKNGRRYDIVRPKYSEMSTHAGRKTFICFMLSIGVAPQVVMKFTGHADYKSMKPYIDIAEKAKTDAMDAMEKALKG